MQGFGCSESGLLGGLGRWWPATGGAGVVPGGWVQGGVRGWFRSMQFPAGGLVGAWKLVPVGIASL